MTYLIDPLFYLAFFGLVYLISIKYIKWNTWKFLPVLMKYIFIFTTISVLFLSIPVVNGVIKNILYIDIEDYTAEKTEPQIIFILSSGYEKGETFEEDILAEDTMLRLFAGYKAALQYKDAIVILSGGMDYVGRELNRMSDLMKEYLLQWGIDESRIITEPDSRFTIAHAPNALKLPEISEKMPIMIVTHAYHIRRSLIAFERYFEHVIPLPVPNNDTSIAYSFYHFMPNSETLKQSRRYLWEFLGIFYYILFT